VLKGGKDTLEHKQNILFGKYLILDRIGEGGTGSVYLAKHTGMEVFRAIKSIKKSYTSSENFFYEVSILKNLRHPGVPIIYDIEEDEEFFYIVEEYIEGVSLDKYLQEYPKLSNFKRISLLKQICDIVDCLHTQSPYPIIHMDIKPQNILINYSTGKVYLVDFGSGNILNYQKQRKFIYGTVGYTRAEQYESTESKIVLDIYSLAKIIYFVLENITDNKLIAMLDECMNDSKCKVRAADLCKYFETKVKGLDVSKKICVVGSQSGVGATHFALALTTELNRRRNLAVYVNYYDSGCIEGILGERNFELENTGIARIKGSYCRILPVYDEGNRADTENNIQVIDMGIADLNKIQAFNDIIFICGSREWQREQTFIIYSELEAMLSNRNVIKICNYCGNNILPYIEDPFKLKYMERKRFEKIMRKIKI